MVLFSVIDDDDLFEEFYTTSTHLTSFSNLKMEPNKFTVTAEEKVHIRIRFNFSGGQRHEI